MYHMNILISKKKEGNIIKNKKLLFEINNTINNNNIKDINPEKVFHGTRIHCIHSILKNGLIMYSNTKNQIHGSAYGKGIYTSTLFSESYHYCNINENNIIWQQSSIKIEICMFLCDYYHNKDWDNLLQHKTLPKTFRIARENNYVIPKYLYIEYTHT